jgi:hypothetical protein
MIFTVETALLLNYIASCFPSAAELFYTIKPLTPTQRAIAAEYRDPSGRGLRADSAGPASSSDLFDIRAAQLGGSVWLMSKGVRRQLSEAVFVGPREVAEVPEAPPQRFARHRG